MFSQPHYPYILLHQLTKLNYLYLLISIMSKHVFTTLNDNPFWYLLFAHSHSDLLSLLDKKPSKIQNRLCTKLGVADITHSWKTRVNNISCQDRIRTIWFIFGSFCDVFDTTGVFFRCFAGIRKIPQTS